MRQVHSSGITASGEAAAAMWGSAAFGERAAAIEFKKSDEAQVMRDA